MGCNHCLIFHGDNETYRFNVDFFLLKLYNNTHNMYGNIWISLKLI